MIPTAVDAGVSAGEAVRDRGPGSGLPRLAKGPVLGIAAAMVAVELAVAARYGFHRDELYFLACARHLAWGYVDQPPLVPAVAKLSVALFGNSVVALRSLPACAAGACVVFTALTARELGGTRNAQVLAALAAATSPQVVAAFHLLSTTSFDLVFWSSITLVVVRLLRTGDQRLWLAVGGLAGVGLLDKLDPVFLLGALLASLLLCGRSAVFRSRWLWAGLLLALVLWSPYLVWNAQHSWAEVSMLHSLRQENSSLGTSLLFIPAQFVVVGPVLVVLWTGGLRHLLRDGIAKPLGVTYLLLLAFFTVTGAKPYYLAGMYFVLFAAGGVWAERRLAGRTPPKGIDGWVALMVAGALVAIPLALPVLPASALPTGSWEGSVNKDLSATVGWPAMVRQIAAVSQALPPSERAHLVIFAGDYGAAGAVDLYGGTLGLPHAMSGHNSYWWWGPAGARNGATTIAVDLPRAYLRTIFRDVRSAGTVATPGGVWTEERGDPIWICSGQTESWSRAWPAARHYG